MAEITDKQNLPPLHVVSPLVGSDSLTKLCNRQVYLKLDNIQPSGSYKIRGLGYFIAKNISKGVKHIVNSSGGNAGMAASYAAAKYNIPATIVIPESTPKMMIKRLQDNGAEVIVHGQVWNEANEKALELAKQEDWLYVHPFDHPLIWEGNRSIVRELREQMSVKPACIVVAVGGGGMICGILEGLLETSDWKDVTVLAMETQGAHCFNAALKAEKPVSIGSITSLAKTLGALTVTSRVFDLLPGTKVISKVIDDKDAVNAVVEFATGHRMLVEPSCGASLAAGYSGIIEKLIKNGDVPAEGPIVFIVCGGSAVTFDLIEGWKKIVDY